MKNYVLLPFFLLLCAAAPAQNCSAILQKIETAYQHDSLDEARLQVQALRACDASAAGRRKADTWTEKIFARLSTQKTAAEQARATDARAAANASLALQTAKNDATLALRMADYNRSRHPKNAAAAAAFKEIISNPQNAFYARAFEAITREEEREAAWRLKPGMAGEIASVAFSPDGREVLTGAEYGKTRLWSLSDGKLIRTFDLSGAAVFSPDGQEILIGNRLFEKNTGLERFRFETGAYSKIEPVFSSLGQVAYVDADTVFLWTKHGEWEARQIDIPQVWSIAFSPDGTVFATGTTEGLVQIWSAENGRELERFALEDNWIHAIAFSPDSRELLIGLEGNAVLWSWQTKKIRYQLNGHGHTVNAVAFSPDGKWLLTGCWDAVTRLWLHETGEQTRRFSVYGHKISSAAFSPACPDDPAGGRYILTGGADGVVSLWPARDEQESLRFQCPEGIRSIAYSPDGREILVGGYDRTAGLWLRQTGQQLLALPVKDYNTWDVGFAPDGKEFFTINDDGRITFWSSETRQKIWALGQRVHPNAFVEYKSVSYAPDGGEFLCVNWWGGMRICPCEAGRGCRALPFDYAEALPFSGAFSPDGQSILAGFSDGALRLMARNTGAEIRRFTGPGQTIQSVAFSADGRTVAGGSTDGTVWVWSVETGALVARLSGHRGEVNYLAFAAGGRALLSGSADGTARLWSLESGQEIRHFDPLTGSIEAVELSPDGKELLLGETGGLVRVMQMPEYFLENAVASFSIAELLASGIQPEPEDLDLIQLPADQLRAAETFERQGNGPLARAFYEKIWKDSVYGVAQWIKLYEISAREPAELPAIREGFESLADSSELVDAAAFLEGRREFALAKTLYEKAWQHTASEPEHLAQLYVLAQKGKLETAGYKAALERIQDSTQVLEAAYALERQQQWAFAYRLFEKVWQTDWLQPDHLATLYSLAVKGGLDTTATARSIDVVREPEIIGQLAAGLEREGLYAKAFALECKLLSGDRIDPENLSRLSLLAHTENLDLTPLLRHFDTLTDPADLNMVAKFFEHHEDDPSKALDLYRKSWARSKSFPVYKNLLRLNTAHTSGDSLALWQVYLQEAGARDLAAAAEQLLEADIWVLAEQLARLSLEKADNPPGRYCLYRIRQHQDADTFAEMFLPDDTMRLTGFFRFFMERISSAENEPGEWDFYFNMPVLQETSPSTWLDYYSCATRIAEKRLSLGPIPVLRTEAAKAYSGLAWYQLRASQFAAAEQSIRRGLQLDAGHLYLRARLPLAILLQGGRFEEARALYLEWADKPFGLDDLDTFKRVFRWDLQAVLDRELVGMERVGEMMGVLGE